ncbi:MAG: hypothetical protein E2604_11080 [Flavobacterium sp.]|nr:hypothetical protein [Flavobacterium sp.]
MDKNSFTLENFITRKIGIYKQKIIANRILQKQLWTLQRNNEIEHLQLEIDYLIDLLEQDIKTDAQLIEDRKHLMNMLSNSRGITGTKRTESKDNLVFVIEFLSALQIEYYEFLGLPVPGVKKH